MVPDPSDARLHPIGEPPMSVTVHRTASATVVAVAGDLDTGTAPLLGATIREVVADPVELLVVDLTAVEFMGSAGLSALMAAHESIGGRIPFRVVAANRATTRTIELTQVDRALDVRASLDDALDLG